MCIGNLQKVTSDLHFLLDQAKKKLEHKECIMESADHDEWQKCQHLWQKRKLQISRYQSALVRSMNDVICTTKLFHRSGLLHFDIKGTYA